MSGDGESSEKPARRDLKRKLGGEIAGGERRRFLREVLLKKAGNEWAVSGWMGDRILSVEKGRPNPTCRLKGKIQWGWEHW